MDLFLHGITTMAAYAAVVIGVYFAGKLILGSGTTFNKKIFTFLMGLLLGIWQWIANSPLGLLGRPMVGVPVLIACSAIGWYYYDNYYRPEHMTVPQQNVQALKQFHMLEPAR